MKLATLKDGTRDGQLVVVSQDLHTAVIADAIAPTMQRVIEDWPFYAPQLHALYQSLNTGRARRAFGFDPTHCMAPLPRAYRLIDGLSREVGNELGSADTPLRSARADRLLGAHDDALFEGAAPRIGFQASLAAIVSDVPGRVSAARAVDGIRLVMLAARWVDAPQPVGNALQYPQEWYGFSPVAVTPDTFGEAWLGQDGAGTDTSHKWFDVQVNGRRLVPAALDAVGHFPQRVAMLAATQPITAGTLVLGGLVARHGEQESPDAGLGFGDRIRIDATDAAGMSVCGAIEQSVAPA